MNQRSYHLLSGGISALIMHQVATFLKKINLRLLKNSLDKKKIDKEILFIVCIYACMYIQIYVCMHLCVGMWMCLYTQDIIDTECFLMQKPISAVHETNKFDLRQKHIFTDCSLFKPSKYDKILYKAILSYDTDRFKTNYCAHKTLRKYFNLIIA